MFECSQEHTERECEESLASFSFMPEQRGTPDIILPKADGSANGITYDTFLPAPCHPQGGYLFGYGHMNKACINYVLKNPGDPTSLQIINCGIRHARTWHPDVLSHVAGGIRDRANSLHGMGSGKSFLEVGCESSRCGLGCLQFTTSQMFASSFTKSWAS